MIPVRMGLDYRSKRLIHRAGNPVSVGAGESSDSFSATGWQAIPYVSSSAIQGSGSRDQERFSMTGANVESE
jgi:hypothetical protein